MNIENERKLATHIRQLGESANSSVFTELAKFTKSTSPLHRRLAASALGKLSGIVDSVASVDLLQPMLQDSHPQVRQYAAKALGSFGTNAQKALDDLRDMYKNPNEKDYVKRSVVTSGKLIRQSMEVAQLQKIKKCGRCGCSVSGDEYARSQSAFERIFCDKCFDEVYLQRRNWDTKVELQKNISTKNGTLVQSHGERIISNFLSNNKIIFRYDERIRIIDGYAIRPDFYLPEFDLYIEYWGMDTIDYKIGMLKKKKLYQQQDKKLISVSYSEKHDLETILKQKLSRYINFNNNHDSFL